jgi:hypothetical protein
MIDLYHYSLLSIFLVGFTAVLVAGEIGWQLGMRTEPKAAVFYPLIRIIS